MRRFRNLRTGERIEVERERKTLTYTGWIDDYRNGKPHLLIHFKDSEGTRYTYDRTDNYKHSPFIDLTFTKPHKVTLSGYFIYEEPRKPGDKRTCLIYRPKIIDIGKG